MANLRPSTAADARRSSTVRLHFVTSPSFAMRRIVRRPPQKRSSQTDPIRSDGPLQTGHSVEPASSELEHHKADVGDLTQPASCCHSPMRSCGHLDDRSATDSSHSTGSSDCTCGRTRPRQPNSEVASVSTPRCDRGTWHIHDADGQDLYRTGRSPSRTRCGRESDG